MSAYREGCKANIRVRCRYSMITGPAQDLDGQESALVSLIWDGKQRPRVLSHPPFLGSGAPEGGLGQPGCRNNTTRSARSFKAAFF